MNKRKRPGYGHLKGGKVVSKRPLRWVIVFSIAVSALCQGAFAQTAIDTLTLDLFPVDSFAIFRESNTAVIRWYPPHDSLSSGIGTIDFRSWISGYDPSVISQMSTDGLYTGDIDRTVRIEREMTGSTDPLTVGVDPSISIRIETIDPVNRTYSKTINIGTSLYTPGDPIPLILLNEEDATDSLFLGFDISFSEGIVDTSLTGGGAIIDMDLQDFEGFHVWRGLSPLPSEMYAIVEISKEDYFKLSDIEAAGDVPLKWLWLWDYFRDTTEPAYPRFDNEGRKYYEWVDENVYPGFKYYYHVTCYDRGYFKGSSSFQHDKVDNYLCDEDPDNPLDPENFVDCESVAKTLSMTVDSGGDSDKEMMNVYAVPNPYRTGSSAEISPAYHNYEDNSIKFHNLPRQCEIRVYNVAGDMVWKHSHLSEDGSDGIASWDVRNERGNDVSSGVYIFRCESSSGGSVYGRIIIIR